MLFKLLNYANDSKALKRLSLRGLSLNAKGWKTLIAMIGSDIFDKLDITGCGGLSSNSTKIIESFSMCNMEHFLAGGIKLDSKNVEIFTKAVSSSSKLKTLSLSGSGIASKHLVVVMNAIKNNKQISDLYLDGNSFKKGFIYIFIFIFIFYFYFIFILFLFYFYFFILFLFCFVFIDDAGKALEEYLKSSKTLNFLSLNNCEFSSDCYTRLYSGLQSSTVTTLRMEGIYFGKKGWPLVSSSIKKIPNLSFISFKKTDLNFVFLIDLLEDVFSESSESVLEKIDISATECREQPPKQLVERLANVYKSVHKLLLINRKTNLVKG